VDPRSRPIGFAHRGARSERRENTIEAFQRALELGATGLESDAWLSADGAVILDHDGVAGPRWRRRRHATQRRADLPAHLPTLAELYAACGTDFELSLDLKDPAALPAILAVAGSADPGARSRLWLCHHSWPEWTPSADGFDEIHRVESTRLSQLGDPLGSAAATLAAAGVVAINLPESEWDEARVAAVHAVGLLAFGWGAQESAVIRRLIDLGVDGIYSDHVDRLVHEIGRGSETADA
jgi:glycerophosphoryl diester phosphodiesterase